ncbi:hypothetical protein ES703_34523 [subsurface metagenome]
MSDDEVGKPSDHSVPPEVSFDRYQKIMEWVRRYGECSRCVPHRESRDSRRWFGEVTIRNYPVLWVKSQIRTKKGNVGHVKGKSIE